MPSILSARNAILIWLSLMIPVVAVHAWLSRVPPRAGWGIETGVAPIYTGFQWLRFHRAHAPKAPGERTMVILGSSNIAGWGDDYRWGARQKMDPWARHSFAAYLQEDFQRGGIPIRVENLAVNGSRLRSQIFLHLDALRDEPDYIVLALSSWTFIRDGDFRDPLPLVPMNTALAGLLLGTDFGSKPRSDVGLLEYLKYQPRPRANVALNASACDQLTAWCAAGMQGMYDGIGIPECVVAPTPKPVVDEVLAQEADIRAHPGDDDLKPGVIFEEMVGLFPKVLPVLRDTAAARGAKLIILAPPSCSRWDNWFNGERLKEAKAVGIRVVDLRHLPLHAEKETYDGHHYTREGNRKLAAEFLTALKRGGEVR